MEKHFKLNLRMYESSSVATSDIGNLNPTEPKIPFGGFASNFDG
jgi:hypothetical protein